MRDEHRRERARHLIKTDYKSQTDFVAKTKLLKGRVSQIVGKNAKMPFGEGAADTWERAAGLPEGWLSNNWPTPKEAKANGWRVDAPYPDASAEPLLLGVSEAPATYRSGASSIDAARSAKALDWPFPAVDMDKLRALKGDAAASMEDAILAAAARIRVDVLRRTGKIAND
ncbi:MAG: hypothetical protein WBC18_07920 [Ottowia sp.]|uniref:hypothetical protein n=1 Tax=Ottowia sp. TaxID=1898956 RepID=UPI003C72B7A8